MSPKSLTLLTTLTLLCAAPAVAEKASESTSVRPTVDKPMATALEHYEAIRGAFAEDRFKGVTESAKELAAALGALRSDFTPERGGVSLAEAKFAEALLPQMEARAHELAGAGTLDAARTSFYKLTLPLVQYRERMVGERPVVVYCSMAEKAWLQPDEPIGNPYYGKSMLRCGKVVSR